MKNKFIVSTFCNLLVLSALGTTTALAADTTAAAIKTVQAKNKTASKSTAGSSVKTSSKTASFNNQHKASAAGKTGAKPTLSKTAKTVSKTPVKATISKTTPSTAATLIKTVGPDGKPVWLSIKAAKLAAKQQKKYIIADVYTDWCHWCKVLDERTFHNSEVEAFFAKGFVCAKVNAEDGADGTELAGKNQVNGYPTVLIFNSNGDKAGEITGFIEAKEFMQKVTAIVSAKGKTK